MINFVKLILINKRNKNLFSFLKIIEVIVLNEIFLIWIKIEYLKNIPFQIYSTIVGVIIVFKSYDSLKQ